MKRLATVIFLALASCASDPGTGLYKDVSGKGRQDPQLRMDLAQCDHEANVMAYSRPVQPTPSYYFNDPAAAAAGQNLGIALAQRGPSAGLHRSCMRARGWELVGYE